MQWYDTYVSEKIYCILLATVTVEIAILLYKCGTFVRC